MFWNFTVRHGLVPHFAAFRFLTFVFLIVIEHVSHIVGFSAQWQQQQQQQHTPPHLLLADTHRLAKRMDLEACLGQFDVHNNTIIRTGESQAIGGKYLQGLELDTMEECQRLCCETESCDVYIFEDKNGGYCYLFNCGPPENFHCKFTRHSNYTSAVLTPLKLATTPRPPPPPPTPPASPAIHQSTSNLSQQEWELTSLKVKPETRDKLNESPSINNVNNLKQQFQTGQQGMELGLPQKSSMNVTAVTQQCSRFQFPCHSGECIAVYNACDGIPQCEDGSDEGTECSGATNNNNNGAKGNLESANVNSITLENGKTQTQYRPSLIQTSSQQQLQNLHQQQQQEVQPVQTMNSPIVNNREDAGAWANRKIVAEAGAGAQQSNGVDLSSHIFTHKNGLQLPHIVSTGSSGSNGNIGAIDMNAGIANYPNSNANLNPLYAATLQRTGLYLPPQLVGPQQQQQNGGMYVVPSQQIVDQQGHVYLPNNVNWAQQQQQQQQQQPALHQFPAVVTPVNVANERGTQMAQGPAYIINGPQQAMPHFSQPQAVNEQQSKVAYLPAPSLNDGKQQVSQQQLQNPSQQSSATVNTSSQSHNGKEKESTKKMLGKSSDTAPAASNDNDGYDEYEDEATEAPKRKSHKHKKLKSKITTANTVGKDLPNVPKSELTDDPVQQSMMAQRKQQQQAQTLQAPQQPQPAPVHEQYKILHENLVMEFHDHDGESDRPGGAVLSLTLGVLVTAALAILIGCRMRTVGRRARRMGGKFSHEADFLVNGMYL